MKKKKFLALLMSVVMLLSSCGSTSDPSQSAAGSDSSSAGSTQSAQLDTLKIGLAAFPTTLDPNYGIGIASIKVFYNMFDTLLFTDKEGNITGQLAESWEWLDDTTLNIKIRPNVTFHNGEACTSEDVKFTFDRILNGYGDGTISVLYETLESVDIIDDLTVQFHLSAPDAAFEDRLGSIWGASIIPKDYTTEVGDEAFATAPVGTGPYKMVSYSPEKYVLERYDGFWGEAPEARQLQFILYPEPSARVTALMTGEVDIINDVGTDMRDTIDQTPGLNVMGTGIKNIHIYVFQTQKDNIMSNEKFRQAVTIAINRQLLVDSLWTDYATVPNGHQFTSYGDLYLEDYPGIEYDLEKARQLVQESGYDGNEVIKIQFKQGYYTNGDQAAQAICSMLGEIGVKAQVEYEDSFSWEFDYIHAWSSASRFDNPLGALWLLFGPGSNPVTQGCWTPTEEFLQAGDTLIHSNDLQQQQEAARKLMEVFDTYCPGTYLYQAEDLYGIRDGLEWDLTYCENQIMPFRAGDIRATS